MRRPLGTVGVATVGHLSSSFGIVDGRVLGMMRGTSRVGKVRGGGFLRAGLDWATEAVCYTIGFHGSGLRRWHALRQRDMNADKYSEGECANLAHAPIALRSGGSVKDLVFSSSAPSELAVLSVVTRAFVVGASIVRRFAAWIC